MKKRQASSAAAASSRNGRPRRRVTAESLAANQRDISVSEFFAKNRHLLGFDNPRKALLTAVKEAVDNSLDACEEGGIIPEIWVHIESAGNNRFKVGIQDNGPGIMKKQIPLIFGKLLYGSKFHRLRMSRGQQGIGISAAGMYGMGLSIQFLGASPAPALLAGLLTGVVVAAGLGQPFATEAALPGKGAEVSVGLRPQHLKIEPAGSTHRVELTEALGGVSYLHLTAPSGEKLIVERHDQISLEPGAMVGLGFYGKDAMVFDSTGQRLR